MQLLIKQRVFSWSDTYDIYDEQGNQKYFVKNEFISLGHRLHVYDAAHNEIGFIKQKLFCFLPTFEIEWNGQLMGHIEKRFALFRPQYDVDFMGWRAEGDFMGWDYDVYEAEAQKDKPVIEYIADKPMTLGDNRVADYIAASAWDGVELPFLIIRVEDWRGAEMDLNGIYNEAGNSLNFSAPGIYKVRVVTRDAGNRKTECDIRIPVSR